MERVKLKKPKGVLNDEAKADRDDKRSIVAVRHTVITAGIRGIAVLNSAGVIVMLGFFQAIAEKNVLSVFKPYGVTALNVFSIGLVIATLLFIPYRAYIQERNRKYKSFILYFCFMLGALSVGCFIYGAMMTVWGIDKAFT